MSNKVKLTELGDAEHKVDSSATIDTAVGGSAAKSAAKVKLTEMHMPQSADATSEDRERLRTQMSLSNITRGYLGDELEDTRQSIEDYNPQMYAQQRRMAAYDYFDKGAGDDDFTPIETRSRIADMYNDAVTDNPRNNYITNKHKVADAMVSSLPTAGENTTDVMLGDTRFTREEAYDAMVGMVEQTMHQRLITDDPRYRSDYFIKNYGTSLRGYLHQLDNTLAELGEALDSEAGREIGALIDAQTHPDAFVGQYIGALAGKESHGAGMIREARDHIRSIIDNDFTSGFAEAFDWTTMLTGGVNELMSGVVLNNVLNKAFNGERLTAREEVAYKAYQVSEELNQLHEMVGGRSTWNNIGMSVGESTEIAPQFAAAMATGGAAAGALGVGLRNLPIRAAGKMVGNSFRKGVLNGIKTGVLTTGRLAGTAALNVGKAEAIGMASSIIMPSTWGNFVDKRNGQFKMEDGKLTFTPSTTWKDAVDAWIEGGAEVGSEMIGGRISSLLGGSARAFGRLIGVDKIASKMGIGKASRTLFGYKKPAFVRNLERNVGFAGPLAEPLSEVWGDASANLLKGAVTGRDNWENITSKEYWLTTLGACAIYGGALTTATSALPIAKRYAQIGIYGHQRKKHLDQIEDAELYNAVVEALAIEDMDEAAQKLASLDWKRYHRIDIGNAMDAIRADYAQRVAIGTEEETARLNYFAGVASRASALAYRGKDGTTLEDYILRIKDKDGIVYSVISGDATSQFYICYDANFNKVSIPTANVVETSQIAVGEEISNEYDTLFSMEGEMRRQSDLIEAYESLRDGKGVGDRIKGLAQQFGVPVRESGDNVTLADGTTRGVVWDYIADKGEYIVATEDGGMVTVPFYDVLSDNESVAEAQTLNYAQRKQTQAQEALDAQDVVTPDGNVVTTPTASRYAVGDIVYTPTGAQVRVRAINSDGTYEVDHNLEESVAPADMQLESFNEADLRGDAAEAVEEVQMQEVEASPTEEVITTEGVAPTEEEIKHDEITPVPMNDDGTINYDTIEDPKQYATLYAEEAGGVEASIEEVRDMRTAIEEEVAKSMEKWKKAKTANEKMQNRRERNALAARMAFYDNVLNILEAQIAPTEAVEATTSKDTRMSVGETDTVSNTPQTEAETPVQREAGLVENEYTPRLRASIAETIDTLAKTFGLVVEFVDDVYDADTGARANADIRGNVVRIAWRNRTRSISFLIGHEFTHRMQDLSTAAYGSFKEAVIKFLGEDVWNARVDAMVSLYERAGIRRSREELEDEVTADVVGMLVRDKHAFETFLENKEKTFIDKVIEVFERIIAAISSKVADNRAVKDVIASLNDLIVVATEVQKSSVEDASADAEKEDTVLEGQRDDKVDAVAEEVGDVLGVQPKFSLASDVASILEEYDTEGVKYGSILDVADGIEAVIAESTEDTTELENILNDFRYAQEDARNWGNRMEAGGEEEFEEALRSYASQGQPKFSLQEVNNRFNEELATLTEENAREKILNVGTPSSILLACGIENKPIRLYGAKLLSKVRKHGYDLDDLKNLPLAMNEPIAVFNGSKPNSFAILTELRVGDNNILVALSVGKGGHDVDFNIISSVYDKRGNSVARWVNDGKMLWVDKKKALDYFSVSAPLAEAQNNQELISTTNIIQNFPNPKVSTRNSLITPEMDASYLEAVDRGDMATAQKMVMEAAEKAGYINDESWRMNHRAPRKDEENANPFNTEKIVPEDFWEHPEWYTNVHHSSETRESYYAMKRAIDKYKRLIAEGKTDEADNVTITMYRGVDKTANKREASFRNGDWITPSRSYALSSAPYGKARVISQEVNLKDIWWDGNSINEWGYDDGANYGYRDTKNNRKLLDPVTYDDNGNVIPLSERFNPKKEDVRYSLIGEQGASALDAYDEVTTRLDNLEVARDMEAMGRDASAIKYATGWERGADGLWRYEVDDEITSYTISRLKTERDDVLAERAARIAELKERGNSALLATYNALPEEYFLLEEVLGEDHPIFAAYPAFRNMRVILAPYRYQSYEGYYDNGTNTILIVDKSGNDLREASVLAHEIQHAIQHKEGFERGTNLDKVGSIDEYNRHAGEVEARNVQTRLLYTPEQRRATIAAATEDVAREDQIMLRKGVAEDGAARQSLYDAPFFNDEGGEVIYFEDDEMELPAIEVRPRTTEGMIKIYMDKRHLAAKEKIRKETRDIIAVTRKLYKERDAERRKTIHTLRTNAAKIDFILGDINRESISLFDQALIAIAEGMVHIRWDSDGTHKGVAAEIGLKDGEKKYYSSITKNATQSFEGFVHDWWESMNGYERGIDVQELRNALIDALRESPTATRAIEILRDKYDTALREMENAIAQAEAQQEKLLADEKTRYEEEVAEFENGEDKASIIRYYEQGQLLNEDMAIAHGALRAMERELNSIRNQLDNKFIKRQISLAEMRKGIEAAKAAVMKAIEETAVLKFNRRDVATLIDKLKDARSLNDVDAIRKRVEGTLQGYMLRQANNDIHRLLQMRLPNGELAETWIGRQIANGMITAAEGKRIMADLWRGHNNKGVSVAKFVHGDTADTMVMLRKMVEENSKREVLERKEVSGEDGKVRTVAAKFGDDKELSLYVEAKRMENITRIESLEQQDEMSKTERVEYEARLLYDKYLDVVEEKQHVNNIREDIEKTRNNDNIEESRKREIINSLYKALPRAKAAYLKSMQDFAAEVSSYMAEGRDKLKAFREAKEKHRNDILALGRNAVGDVKVTDNPPTVWESIKASARNTISDPDYTYMTTLRVIDHKAPNGEGKFYEHFAYAAQQASDNFFNAQYVHYSRLKDAIAQFFPELKGMNPFKAYAEIMRRTDEIAVGTIQYAKTVVNGVIKEQTTLSLNLSNAMYVAVMWDQPRYQVGMAKHGITEDVVNNLKEAIPEEYKNFMAWVRDTFLPDTRNEYDEVHRRMFGISMDEEVNYFPARIMGYIQQVDISESEKNQNAKPSVTTGAIISRKEHGLMPDVRMGYFQMLQAHIQNMDKWAAYAELNEEHNILASDNVFKSRLETMMPGDGRGRSGKGSLYDIYVSRCAIMAQCFNYAPTSVDNIALWFQKNWATANITHRYFTALKQLSGLAVYAVTPKDLTQQLGRFAKNPAKYMREVSKLSPSFRQRWESRIAGSEILNKELNASGFADLNRSKRSSMMRGMSSLWSVINTVAIEWGMAPNAAVDAVVSAIGFMTLYEGSLNDKRKEGKEVTAADRKKAILEAEMRFNETQQSNEGAYLSRLQRQRSFLLAGQTTFRNASFGLHRLRKEALRELFKRRTEEEIAEIEKEYGEGAVARGKNKAWSKLMMGIFGEAAFISMGYGIPALFAMLGGGEDDDETPWWEDLLVFLRDVAMQSTFGGYIGGDVVINLVHGYDYDLTASWTDLVRDMGKIWYIRKDDNMSDIFSWDRISIYSLTQFIAKYGIGVDTKTFANIVKGLEGTVEGMIYGDGTAEAILMFLNAPKSNINAIAGRIRKGETALEYMTRILRLESIIIYSDYKDYFSENVRYIGDKSNNDFMIAAYRARNLLKEYNESYKRSVIRREGGVSMLRDVINTDNDYANIVKKMGWTPEARPNNKALEGGSYVAPVQSIEYGEYERLSNIQTYIAEMSDLIENFAGTDEGYYALTMQIHEAKKNLIKYYDEFNE